MRVVRVGLVSVAAAVIAVAGAAGPVPLDLASLDELVEPTPSAASVWDDVPIEPVSLSQPGRARFYLTGMLGESFATLAEPVYAQLPGRASINRSVLTAGGAAGVALDRGNGRLRIEAEGRGRDDVIATFDDRIDPFLAADFRWAAADGWSALVNVWRDYTVTEHVDVYMGGGLGGGGYRYSIGGRTDSPGPADVTYAGRAQVATFAWQAGGGAIWSVSDRVAVDVGYRFFSIDQADATVFGKVNGFPIGSVTLPQQFTASELLVGLRIYEPFRRWR
jgi:opacity protein-like surface antigen